MAHYAYLDQNNMVTMVIVGKDETELINGLDTETYYGALRTSYNGNIRKRFAGIGMIYRADLDAFVTPQCHEEAILNETTIEWECSNVEHNRELP
jgi:hypothetical protein